MEDTHKYIDDIENEDYGDGYEDEVLKLMYSIKETSDLYYLSLLILDQLGTSDKGGKRYKSISELAYLTDTKSFLNLVYYYGGKTIKIPTYEEVGHALKLISLYYYYDIQGYGWKESLARTGISTDTQTSLSYKSRLVFFRKHLSKLRFPQELKRREDEDNEN